MNDEVRDPALQALFASADQPLPEEPFTEQVMARVGTRGHRTLVFWICTVIVLAPCVWVLAPYVQAAVLQLLQSPLTAVDDPGLAQMLAPINNVASALALGIIALRWALRKIIAS